MSAPLLPDMAALHARLAEVLHEEAGIGHPSAMDGATAILQMPEMEQVRYFIQLYTDMGNRWDDDAPLSTPVQLWVVAE